MESEFLLFLENSFRITLKIWNDNIFFNYLYFIPSVLILLVEIHFD